MKKFIITISIVLVMALACSQIAVFAMSNNDQADQESAIPSSEDYILFEHNEEDVNAKKEMEKQYESNFIQLSENEISLRQNNFYDILYDESIDEMTKIKLLEEMKIYPFISSSEKATLAAAPGGVSLGIPALWYDSMLNRWTISASGNWKSWNDIEGDLSPPWYIYIDPRVGDTWNVGGNESVGISITNTSGSTAGLLRTAGHGRLSTPGLSNSVSNSNSSTSNSHRGAAFLLQDYCYIYSVNWLGYAQYRYIGYNFNVSIEYNSSFANWNGTAQLFYAHTWSTTGITGIGINATGFSLSWVNYGNGWPLYGLGMLY